MSSGPELNAGMTVALLAGAAGVVTGNTVMFLSSVVGFVYAAYQFTSGAPELSVELDREVEERSPRPSEDVTVTLTVENDGDDAIADLRIVDGVPERLAVVDGSPRHGASLGPGETVSFSYAVRSQRGTHEFGPTTLVAKSMSGTREVREKRTLPATITCDTFVEDVPLSQLTTPTPGHIETDASGEGIEFHSTREYRPSDPMSRIDWKRFARTKELTTVNFRESRAAAVLLLVDARSAASIARRSGEPDAIDLSVYAAERIANALVRQNDRVGVALYGPQQLFLPPGGGREQVARVRATLEEVETPKELSSASGLFGSSRNERTMERRFKRLRKRLSSETQVIFLSPLADDTAVDVAKRFDAYGHAVTVVTPDMTGTETPGGAVSEIARTERLNEIRRGNIRAIDWSPDEPLATAVEKSARWSA
ncbi:DUF58 domain-containing protein (plasmid) [Haladaptatus sp. SPP-AMP-3]|uniref:DUF58 domain-containing protein n=1 Tax=Haladaptatus sp. SPP-AMP-3 TaxID=3121295 RepID=UPI003C2C434B